MTDTAAPNDANPAQKSRGRKALSVIFNIAAGAAATIAVKTAVVATMTWAMAPAVASLVVSSLAVGLAMTAFKHVRDVQAAKKTKSPRPDFLSSANVEYGFKSSSFALLGGALFLGFTEGVFGDWFDKPGVKDLTPTVLVDPPAPPCPTTMQAFEELVRDVEVSERVNEALGRVSSPHANISAQALKDLGYFALNGYDGVPQNERLGIELLAKAAETNTQAKIDLLFAQYHGIGGLPENQAAAHWTMSGIRDSRAAELVQEWGGRMKPAPAFNAAEIIKTLPPRCP